MKYLKEPVTNRVVKGKDFGAFFDGWQELTQSEIDAYELVQAKDQKLALCKAELSKNDWQAAAYLKRNRPIDQGVAEREKGVIKLMTQIEACTTSKQLEDTNLNF